MDNDQILLEQFRHPEMREAAFTAIVRKYEQRLYWHIRRMVVNHEDANDLLQNVFIKIWNHLADFRENAQLFTWMYRIATNECLTFLEQRKKYTQVSLDDKDENLISQLKAEKHFDAQKTEWKLQQAILQLPEKQRLVFNLRYYDEMPYAQMSKILNTSEGALKASYHHAVKKISALVQSLE